MIYKRCLLFLLDGARPDIFQSELKAGNLPNFSRYLVEPGTFETILTSFPSTTGPAYLPILTGCHPGTCNVPGIRWFDKEHYAKKGWSLKSFRSYVGPETFLMGRDVKPGIATLFDLCDRSGSIFNMITRGLKRGENRTRFNRIWYIYYAHLTDHWFFVDEAATQKMIDSLKDDPQFVFAVFPSIDELSHRSSPFHPHTVEGYAHLDRLMGRLVQALKKKGWLEDTLLVATSDHGLSETTTHFDVGPFLEQKGIKTFFYTQILKRNFRAASMVSGNGMAHLYFRGHRGWGGRLTYEEMSRTSLLIDELRLRPEIDLVAAQGEGGALHLLTGKGHAEARFAAGKIRYEWQGPSDPLEIFKTNGNFVEMTEDESLEKTFSSRFPDVFFQMKQLFSAPRSGDLIISARVGSDLRERYEVPIHKSSHGSIAPEHMLIPLLTNHSLRHPGRHVRSVDLFPTILKLLGKEIPDGIDGRSLV